MSTKFKFEIESEGLTQEQAQAFGTFVKSLQSKVTGLVTRGIDAEVIEKAKDVAGAVDTVLINGVKRLAGAKDTKEELESKRKASSHRRKKVIRQEEPKQEEPKQEEPKQEEPKQEEPKQEEPKQEEPKQEEPKQKRRRTVKAKEEPKQEEPKQEEPKQEEPKQEAQASKYTIQDVRAKLTPLVKTNRDAIIEKLRSFDAKSVTALDPKHYDAMMVFLGDLEDGLPF